MIIILNYSTTSYAALVDLGNGIIKDDADTRTKFDDKFWIADTAQFAGMTYDEQISTISGIDVSAYGLDAIGISSFSMASRSDVYSIWNSDADTLTNLFTSNAENTKENTTWWVDRYDEPAYINGQYPYEGNYFHHQTLLVYYNDGFYAEKRIFDSVAWDESLEPGAWAVAKFNQPAPGSDPMSLVTTDQFFLTDFITLGDTFSFDYFWEMESEPTDFNLDALFFNGTEWETFGWQLNFSGSSTDWTSASFYVPTWARGQSVQIKFSLFDWGQETDPVVYLRNIASTSTPVPEPTTLLLFGSGLAGLAAVGRKRR